MQQQQQRRRQRRNTLKKTQINILYITTCLRLLFFVGIPASYTYYAMTLVYTARFFSSFSSVMYACSLMCSLSLRSSMVSSILNFHFVFGACA